MRRVIVPASLLVLALVLVACGSGNSGTSETSEMTGAGTSHSSMAGMAGMSATVGSSDHGQRIAEAAPADQASRTVTISAGDKLAFDPAAVSVKLGETVVFTVTNTGQMAHEFTLGTAAFQEEHEHEMKSGMNMGSVPPDEAAFVFGLAPGESKTVAYRFSQAGQLIYGCHVPGHFTSMRGTITVR